jgi:hypothetical protein
LVSEGYVIEFNDGSLDLPRVKVKAAGEKPSQTAEKTSDAVGKDAAVSVPAPEPPGSVLAATTATISEAETKPTSDSQPGEETNANPPVSPSQGEDCSPTP